MICSITVCVIYSYRQKTNRFILSRQENDEQQSRQQIELQRIKPLFQQLPPPPPYNYNFYTIPNSPSATLPESEYEMSMYHSDTESIYEKIIDENEEPKYAPMK